MVGVQHTRHDLLAPCAGQVGGAVTAIAAGATILAPAAGYLYGGRSMRGLLGVGIRLGGIGLAKVGRNDRNFIFGPAKGCEWIWVGGAIVLTSAIVDLVMVDNAVRDHNARRGARVGLAPYLEPSGGAGVLLTVRH